MSGDDIRAKLSEMTPKAWAGVGLVAVLLLVLVYVWRPTGVKIDPKVQQVVEQSKADKDANPPVPEYKPDPSDGPRRRAAKAK